MIARKCSKSFKLGFSSTWTENFQMYKLDLEKHRATRDQIANMCWVIEKVREFQKNIYFCFIDYFKAFDCVDNNKLWKILKKMRLYQTTLPASWETYMQVKKQQSEPDMEQQTSSKLKDDSSRLYIVTLFFWLIYRVRHEKCQAEWSSNWNRDCWEKYQQPQICRWYHSDARKLRGSKEPLDEGEREEWKSWLKTQHWKN